jgi:hypothetical protein
MKTLVLLMHFVCSAAAAVVTACVFQTQMVLLGLTNLGVNITWTNRMYMVGQDLLGLLPTYGIIVTVGLAIGFGVTKAIKKYTRFNNYALYVLAGGVTMLVILFTLHPILHITLLAGARSGFGLLLQIVAGLLGGFIFMSLRKAKVKPA